MEPTINTISQSTFIWSILGSTVVATVVGFVLGWTKESFQQRKLDQKKCEKNLYADLRMHLMLLSIAKETLEELWNDRSAFFKESTENLANHAQKGELLMQNLDQFRPHSKRLIDEEWAHIDAIKKLLENGAKYIHRDHETIIKRFIKEYCIREIVAGKSSYHDKGWVFSPEKHKQAVGEIFKVLDELYEKIK